jgi:hypothetical protein
MINGQATPASTAISGELLTQGIFFTNSLVLFGESFGNGNLISSPLSIFSGEIRANGNIYPDSATKQGELISSGIIIDNSNYQKFLLAIQDYFGENVSQNLNFLILKKSDLIGLTLNSSNTAESLLAAIIKRIFDMKDDNRKVKAEYVNTYFNLTNSQINIIYQVNCLQKPSITNDEIQFQQVLTPNHF